MIDSDYGRLKALGSVANSRDWSVNDAELVERLRNTSRASFASVLMPVAYGVHALQRRHASWELTEADGISCRSFGAAQAWVGTPDSVQIAWMGNFDRDGYQGERIRQAVADLQIGIVGGKTFGRQLDRRDDLVRL